MDVQNKTRALIEAAMMTALTSIFAIVRIYIPILTFISFFIPVPLTILGKKHGLKFTIISVFASGMIIGMFTEPIYSIFITILYGSVSVAMGYMMNKKYKPSKILLSTMLVAIISLALCIQMASKISGIDMVGQMIDMFDQAINMNISLQEKIGTDQAQMEQMKVMLENMLQMMKMMIPFMVISAGGFLAYINYRLTTYVLKRLGHKVEALPPIREVRLPKSIVMGTFLIMGLTIMTKNLGFANYTTLVLNVFLIFQFIYLIQGVAVVSYFMHSYKLRKPLRIFIYIFLLLNQMTAFMLAIIGFIDAIIDVRNRRKIN
ncbi:YybS family protein [Lutibacter sp. B2]|nr:YybS family protein [Lutibacter sp. B2]